MQFKESVIVVAQNGGDEFVSLRDAIKSVHRPSSIVMLPWIVHAAWPSPDSESNKLEIQIIGEGDKIESPPREETMRVSSSRAGLVRTYHYAHWSLMQLVGALQQLPTSLGPYELRRRICTARPRFSEGASTSSKCTLRSSSGASRYADSPGSTVNLSQCKVFGKGGGLLAQEGLVEASRCVLKVTGSCRT